mmetsp:Transcript_78969/g.139766  ORF Transcript_78969/g.139766 Transcript_78969/m.139766 type:complete len:513 (-) Transcript_78969:137-1675(-)
MCLATTLVLLSFCTLNSYEVCLEGESCANEAHDANLLVSFLQQGLLRTNELGVINRTSAAPKNESSNSARGSSEKGVFQFALNLGESAGRSPDYAATASEFEPPSDSVRPLPYYYTIAYRLSKRDKSTILDNLLSMKGLCVGLVLVGHFVSFSFTRYSFLVKQMVILSLLCGMLNVLIKDGLTHIEVPTSPRSWPSQFNQPSLYNLVTMVGLSFCGPLYFIMGYVQRWTDPDAEEKVQRPHVPMSVYVITMTLHWSALFIVNVAYQHLLGSTIQMMRGSKLLFTCILSFIFLDRKMKVNQVLGVATAFVGVVLAAHQKTNIGKSESAVKWICIVCCSEFIRSILFVYQEKVMKQYEIPPLKLTGMIGMLGTPFSIMGAVLANHFGIEDFSEGVYQVQQSAALVRVLMCFVLSALTFELFSITLTKRADAVLRALTELLRIPLVWLVEIVLNWDTFAVWQASGLVMLFLAFFLEQSSFLKDRPAKDQTAAFTPQDTILAPEDVAKPWKPDASM